MKKVLQSFFGKITILVSMLCAFAYTGNSQAHITMSTANCTISANEVQMDIRVTNDGTQDLRWNSTVLRMIVPAGMLPVGGTYSFQCVGAGDFPLSWPAVLPANAFGANYAAATRTITWTTGNTSAYNNLTCTAPLIPMGATMTIARFSFKCTNNNFAASQNATFTWSATSSCNLYQTSPTCAAAVTGFSTTVLRTQAPPCTLTVPSTCAVTGSATTTNASCAANADGTATVTLTGVGSGAPGTYSLDGGPATAYATNPFTVSGLSAGPHNIVATVTASGCESSSIAANITANPLPTVSFTGLPATICANAAAVTLTGNQAPGGIFTGPGITDNANGTASFDPSTAGAGGIILYTYTGVVGCTNSSSQAVTVNAALSGNAIGTDVSCPGATDGSALVTLTNASIFSGAQEVPPVPSAATGIVAASFNSSTNALSLNIIFSNLSSNTTNAHIHLGAPGVSGGVQIGLVGSPIPFPLGVTSGTASGTITLTAPQVVNFLAGNFYVNIHTTNYPGGEIRAQLAGTVSGTYTLDGGVPQAFNSNPFTISGLAAGPHTIVATSTAGCVSNNIGVSIGAPAQLTGTTTSTPTTCGNPTSGTITVTLSSGTSGTYTLDGGAATAYNTNPFTITGVTGGPHTVVATSAAGCVSNSMSETVGSTSTFTATVVKTNITSCNAGNDGTITVTPNGGQAPFTYVWTGVTGSGNPATGVFPDPVTYHLLQICQLDSIM